MSSCCPRVFGFPNVFTMSWDLEDFGCSNLASFLAQEFPFIDCLASHVLRSRPGEPCIRTSVTIRQLLVLCCRDGSRSGSRVGWDQVVTYCSASHVWKQFEKLQSRFFWSSPTRHVMLVTAIYTTIDATYRCLTNSLAWSSCWCLHS